MQLSINSDRKISEVQQDFNNAFPFIKIEFFRNGLKRKSLYPSHLRLSNQLRLKDAWIWKKDSGLLNLSDSMTVQELEQMFIDEFGLSVQVFRKSGNVWLETTMTDNWSLKQQNEHGREMSRGHSEMYRPYTKDADLERDND